MAPSVCVCHVCLASRRTSSRCGVVAPPSSSRGERCAASSLDCNFRKHQKSVASRK